MTSRIDIISYLTARFPNRNWGEVVRRYDNNETIQTAQKIAIERAISELK